MSNPEQTLFNTDDEVNQPEQPSQAAPENENNSDFDLLVGDGKKFSDKESLAKGKLESDKHVTNLENQIKDMREELSKRDTAQEIAEQLRNDRQPDPAPVQENTSQGLTGEEVADIVLNTVTSLESSRSTRENITSADAAFKAVHGDKAQEVLDSKAKELGMSAKELGDIAGKSPTAFAKMVGLEDKSAGSGDQSPMVGDQNPEALNVLQLNVGVKEGSQAYWNAKRKELGAAFWEPKWQQQVIKDKEEGRYDA